MKAEHRDEVADVVVSSRVGVEDADELLCELVQIVGPALEDTERLQSGNRGSRAR
jgi:hypothetical protein